jgi:7,8-dihydro-6-hydroxymethylpterin-pyrophosphokinase
MERRFVLAPLRDLAPDLVSERDLHLAHGTVRRTELELAAPGGAGGS